MIVLAFAGCSYFTSGTEEEDTDTTEMEENMEMDEMKEDDMGAMIEVSPAEEDVGDAETGYMDVSAEEAKELIDSMDDLVVIDVSPNYANGHLPGAVNYYVGDGSLDEAIPELDMTGTYLVYCHAESASRQGAQKLVDAGFENVYRLDGDYSAWVDAGYEIEK